MKKMLKKCSTEQSCINIGITCYKIGTLTTMEGLKIKSFEGEGFASTYSCQNLGLLNHMVLTISTQYGPENEMQVNQKIQPGIQHSRFLFESLTASLSLILIISHFCSPCWSVLVFSDSLGLLTDQPSVCTFPNAGWQRLFLDFIFLLF